MSTNIGSFWDPLRPPQLIITRHILHCSPPPSHLLLDLNQVHSVVWRPPFVKTLSGPLCLWQWWFTTHHVWVCGQGVFLRPIFPVFPLMPFWSLMKNLNHISISKLFSFIQRKPPTQFQSLYLKEIFKRFFAHQPFKLRDWKNRKEKKAISFGSVPGFGWRGCQI